MPLLSRGFSFGDDSPKSPADNEKKEENAVASRPRRYSGEAFCFADELEGGLAFGGAARGAFSATVQRPIARGTELQRLNIIYQANQACYLLLSETHEMMLAARPLPCSSRPSRVDFHFEVSDEWATGSEESTRPPAFTLVRGEGPVEDWTLLQARCESCVHRPRLQTCDYQGKGQQVARIRHSRKQVGPAKISVHSLEVCLPPLTLEGTESVIWCPLRAGRDLGSRASIGTLASTPSACSVVRSNSNISRGGATSPSSAAGSMSPARFGSMSPSRFGLSVAEPADEPLELCSRLPKWDDELEALVLNFERRKVSPSLRNFMLCEAPDTEDAKIVCQHALMGDCTYCLDVAHPLSPIQAFAVAMASLAWTEK